MWSTYQEGHDNLYPCICYPLFTRVLAQSWNIWPRKVSKMALNVRPFWQHIYKINSYIKQNRVWRGRIIMTNVTIYFIEPILIMLQSSDSSVMQCMDLEEYSAIFHWIRNGIYCRMMICPLFLLQTEIVSTCWNPWIRLFQLLSAT